jgi:hypothetical protein
VGVRRTSASRVIGDLAEVGEVETAEEVRAIALRSIPVSSHKFRLGGDDKRYTNQHRA